MGSLKLTTASSGSVILSPANTASDVTITVPASTSTMLTTTSTFGATGPAFSAYQSSSTSVSNATATKVLFGTEQFDTNSNFASSTFTPTVAGYYQVNGKISFSANATNSRWVALYKNGSKVADIGWGTGNGTNFAEIFGGYLIYMNGTTDYLDLYAYQNSGSTLTTDGGAQTYFSASLVRAA